MLLSVCVGGMSVMAVSDAICEHKNFKTVTTKVATHSEEFGHTGYCIIDIICEECQQVLSSHQEYMSESHDYKIILSSSYDDYDDPYYRTVYIDVQECTVCGYTITNQYEIIH